MQYMCIHLTITIFEEKKCKTFVRLWIAIRIQKTVVIILFTDLLYTVLLINKLIATINVTANTRIRSESQTS